MRIIAGEKGGLQILPPRDDTTRPLPDRVKAALFSILGGNLPAVNAADFFSGTGSFGLEALSRGASHCVFFERDREGVRRLRANLETTGLADRAVVCDGDVFHRKLPPAGCEPGSLGLVSFDPPYRYLEAGPMRPAMIDLIRKVLESGWLAPDATLMIRHEKHLSAPLEGLEVETTDVRTWSGMTVTFFRKASTSDLRQTGTVGETEESAS